MRSPVALRTRRQIWLTILRGFKRVNELLFTLKLSENQWFSDDVGLTEVILLNSLIIRSEILRRYHIEVMTKRTIV